MKPIYSERPDAVTVELAEKERLQKLMEQEAALRIVKQQSKKDDWTPEDTQMVLQALGLEESPAPLRASYRR